MLKDTDIELKIVPKIVEKIVGILKFSKLSFLTEKIKWINRIY